MQLFEYVNGYWDKLQTWLIFALRYAGPGAVDVKHTSEHELTLEWESSASNDMIADACLALILGIDKSPASVKRTPVLMLSSRFLLCLTFIIAAK